VAEACPPVEELGGRVVMLATATPIGFVYAHVAEPTGGHVGLWTPPPQG